uniref:Uncharacterized protein n=1 Tax=Myotis myotis TaxID=51298 RepID=A0A7J7U5L6_MYOMY|nr:hypothetical protein mMyoMyo1_008890 [Myotis myotis]
MLIKAIVRWLERDPMKGAFLRHPGAWVGQAVCLGSFVLPASRGGRQPQSGADGGGNPSTRRFCAHRRGTDSVISPDSRCALATSAFAGIQEGLCGMILPSDTGNISWVPERCALGVAFLPLYSCCLDLKISPEHGLPGQAVPGSALSGALQTGHLQWQRGSELPAP